MTTDDAMRARATDNPISDAEAAALFGALRECPALVVAVSGGPDSTALLWLAARWRAALERGPKLIAVTVDHGLRADSAREALAVKRLSKTLKVEHHTLRWAGRKPRTGVQEAAREARYRLLSQAARKASVGHILTAHTLDDQAETVLFRMARGSGISGLAGMGRTGRMPVGSGLLVRPLLDVPKARLIATLDAANVPYVLDPTNDDPRYARTRLRAILPVLAREGLTAERFGRLAHRAERVEDALFAMLNDAQTVLCPDPWPDGGPVSVDPEAFLDLPSEISLRLLRRMIVRIGNESEPELGQLETLYAELRAAGMPIWLGDAPDHVRRTLAGALITLVRERLTVERAPPRRSLTKTSTSPRQGAFTKRRSR